MQQLRNKLEKSYPGVGEKELFGNPSEKLEGFDLSLINEVEKKGIILSDIKKVTSL